MNDREIFCAIKDNKLIGTIALKENFILGFYVNYSIRKIGIGTKLLDYLEKYAFSNNIKKLKLTSTPSAFKFYKKREYAIKEKVTLSIYGVEYPEVEMEKILSDTKPESEGEIRLFTQRAVCDSDDAGGIGVGK